CVDLHVIVSELEGIGSTHQPFFSLLTVYTELGLVGIVCLLIVLLRVLATIRRRGVDAPERRSTLVLVATGTLFLVLLGFQQTYWEIPQAILIGCLVLKVLYAHNMYDHAEAPSISASSHTVTQQQSQEQLQ